MNASPKDIKNRPKELLGLPRYRCLPEEPFYIDLENSIGQFLFNDIFDLDGVQPIEQEVINPSTEKKDGVPLFGVNPSKEAIDFYEKRGDNFQMINVVVCCYGFEEKDGKLFGLPYHISIRPAQNKGLPANISIKWIEQFDLSRVLDGQPHYMGYNPFSNAFGLFAIGNIPVNENIFSDTVGFVYQSYFLSSKYSQQDVCDPGMCTALLGESRTILNDYRKFRFSRYFKPFINIEPIKIWGCDSPIELFLLQAMHSFNLRPKIQMHIFKDGSSFPSLHSMWEDGVRTKNLARTITEADFFFEEQRVAVFCDSVAHHSSPEAIAKDKAIDASLNEIGIHSIRISGPDIVQSPMSCAKRVADIVNGG
ncbi:PDDEXK family nuclease [Klebsiella michiganensis]|uniref:hypothetical protein n=2 Tax=Klebsiella michiganensis TaxID=1134687 RepID=UPI000C9BFE4C|nr:hypothetical protein [Klebsiella michiganensis]MBL6026834.1 hypothetical protein [Klebsiella michiganensis]MDU1377561.1 hypothetical protein [Klebsiella michiganensis]